MMLGYRLSAEGDTPKLAGLCQSLRPFSGLEGRPPASFYVNTRAIYPRARNLGLGAVLLEAAERRAQRAHCTSLILEVSRENEAAQRFYVRNGFAAWDGAREGEGAAGPAIVVM